MLAELLFDGFVDLPRAISWGAILAKLFLVGSRFFELT
jgi:hypothetical protein